MNKFKLEGVELVIEVQQDKERLEKSPKKMKVMVKWEWNGVNKQQQQGKVSLKIQRL